MASAVGMDKDILKRVLLSAGVPVTPWVTLHAHERDSIDFEGIAKKFGYPLFVKPANGGSSVGVSKAENLTEFKKAVDFAFRFDIKILVEKGIKGREVETAVLGNLENIRVSGIGEIVMQSGFYDYEAKYISATAAQVVIPAQNVSPRLIENIRQAAAKAYQALGLEGLARIDFFAVNDEQFYLNEPNTLPGFTNISMYPKLWMEQGMTYPQIVDALLDLAIARHRREEAMQRTR
jgi:D-alanine-D-alanine ligase